MFYVSEYVVDRCYGGPEEGGWWYDEEVFVKCHDAFRTENEARKNALSRNAKQRKLDREDGKRPRWSVIGEPDTVFYVESHPAQLQNVGRPRYE